MKQFRPATGSMRGLNSGKPKKPRDRINRVLKSKAKRKLTPRVPGFFGIRLW